MSSIVSRSPFFNDVVRLYPWADLDNIAQDFGVRPSVMDKRNINLPSIKIDLTENDTAYTVRAEIPGIKKEDVTVEVDGNFVSISVKTKHEKEKKEGERVIYACGAVIKQDDLIVYYGAADTTVCAATIELSQLLAQLKSTTTSQRAPAHARGAHV